MKKTIKVFTILFMAFAVMLGCTFITQSQEVQASKIKVTKYTKKYSYSKNGEVVATATYKGLKAKGNSKIAKRINSLNKKKFEEFKEEWRITRKGTETDFMYGPYVNERELTIVVNNAKQVCIQSRYYSYGGGAHGMSGLNYYSLDRKTGKDIKITRYTKLGRKAFNKKVIKAVEKYEKAAGYDGMLWDSYADIINDYKLSNYVFYRKNNKLHVVFGEYELGAYAAGIIDVVVE